MKKSKPLVQLQPPDNYHLRAVQGWLELGNWREANEALEQITPQSGPIRRCSWSAGTFMPRRITGPWRSRWPKP